MTICIIPARSGSKRIKNKNIKKINNVPLLGIVIKIALKSKIFKRIIVSTDSKKISKLAIKYGAEVPYIRNKKLADDYTTTYEVLVDVVKKLKLKEKYIFCLYPTAIFTVIKDLKKAFILIKKKNANLVCPVIKLENRVLRSFYIKNNYIKYIFPKYKLFRSQDLPEVLSDTGSFYIYNTKALLRINKKNIMPKKTAYYLLNSKHTIDINYPKDLRLAIKLFKKLKKFLYKSKRH